LEIEGGQRNLQRDGPVGDGHTVLAAAVRRPALLELLDVPAGR
jgi:hypothetical protein